MMVEWYWLLTTAVMGGAVGYVIGMLDVYRMVKRATDETVQDANRYPEGRSRG
jgi:hypothetical protein